MTRQAKSFKTGAGLTERLARAAALHPWRTIAIYAVLIAVAVLSVAGLLSSGLTSESKFRAGEPGSVTADRLIEERLSGPHKVTDFVIVRSADLTVDEPAFKAHVLRVADRIDALGGDVVTGTLPRTTPATIPACSPMTSTPRSSPLSWRAPSTMR